MRCCSARSTDSSFTDEVEGETVQQRADSSTLSAKLSATIVFNSRQRKGNDETMARGEKVVADGATDGTESCSCYNRRRRSRRPNETSCCRSYSNA